MDPGQTWSTTPYNHYSLLASLEDVFGLPYLGYAATRTGTVRPRRLQLRLALSHAPLTPRLQSPQEIRTAEVRSSDYLGAGAVSPMMLLGAVLHAH